MHTAVPLLLLLVLGCAADPPAGPPPVSAPATKAARELNGTSAALVQALAGHWHNQVWAKDEYFEQVPVTKNGQQKFPSFKSTWHTANEASKGAIDREVHSVDPQTKSLILIHRSASGEFTYHVKYTFNADASQVEAVSLTKTLEPDIHPPETLVYVDAATRSERVK